DHAWLTRLLLGQGLSAPFALYVEWPYASRSASGRGRVAPEVPECIADRLGPVEFRATTVHLRDRLAKWRAIRRYTSQLPLLYGSRRPRARSLAPGLMDAWRGGEEILGWPQDVSAVRSLVSR
ncbi:MAG: hypothetical protein RMM28_08000, partial [Thermoleophilia bacterium]|nr:hypothetical protein [Gaiellaceae bacterium]MDW8339063.1 hypothetical protein [Thermoleophilia bacterium]